MLGRDQLTITLFGHVATIIFAAECHYQFSTFSLHPFPNKLPTKVNFFLELFASKFVPLDI